MPLDAETRPTVSRMSTRRTTSRWPLVSAVSLRGGDAPLNYLGKHVAGDAERRLQLRLAARFFGGKVIAAPLKRAQLVAQVML
jgi:hypothetical protein